MCIPVSGYTLYLLKYDKTSTHSYFDLFWNKDMLLHTVHVPVTGHKSIANSVILAIVYSEVKEPACCPKVSSSTNF